MRRGNKYSLHFRYIYIDILNMHNICIIHIICILLYLLWLSIICNTYIYNINTYLPKENIKQKSKVTKYQNISGLKIKKVVDCDNLYLKISWNLFKNQKNGNIKTNAWLIQAKNLLNVGCFPDMQKETVSI